MGVYWLSLPSYYSEHFSFLKKNIKIPHEKKLDKEGYVDTMMPTCVTIINVTIYGQCVIFILKKLRQVLLHFPNSISSSKLSC